jgi:glycosyltransferase involved in cell wall biosynthesis
MPTRPAVSVLLPVYNAEHTVSDAVESILKQSFTDFELIAIDDGSTDQSLSILKTFAAADARVQGVGQSNTGIAGALNNGIARARGEFIARMDADDISLPTRLEKQVGYLREHPACVLLGSRVILVEPFGSPLYETDHQTDNDPIVAELLSGVGWAVVHPAAMMRADAVRTAGGYRSEFVPIEDLDLFLRLSQLGTIANLAQPLLHYRQHLQSANHTRFAEQEAKKRACVADAYQRRGLVLPPGWSPPPRRQLAIEAELNQWAWAALKHGNLRAARRHALSLLGRRPISPASWRLLYCAVRGR